MFYIHTLPTFWGSEIGNKDILFRSYVLLLKLYFMDIYRVKLEHIRIDIKYF